MNETTRQSVGARLTTPAVSLAPMPQSASTAMQR